MTRTPLRACSLALLAALLLGAGAAAQEATPVASPTAVDPAGCTIEPRSEEELRALIPAGFRIAVGAITETLAAGDGATPVTDDSTPQATPAATPPPGEPADEATTAAATEVVRQFNACSAAGNLPAVAALITDAGAAPFLGFGVAVYVQAVTGTRLTPDAALDPALLDAYIAALAVPVPPPARFRTTIDEIGEVTRLDDGRVLVAVTVTVGTNEPGEDSVVLREVDGRYLIVFGDESDDGTGAPPAAATPAVATPVE